MSILFEIFELKDFKKANAFIKKHTPYSDAKQSGLIIAEGSIIIRYDDGEDNEKPERKVVLMGQASREKGGLLNQEVELRKATNELARLTSHIAGYKEGMEISALRKIFRDNNFSQSQADQAVAKIESLNNIIFMSGLEIKRINCAIETIEEMIKELE